MTFQRSQLMGMALKAHMLEPLATKHTETSRKKARLQKLQLITVVADRHCMEYTSTFKVRRVE